MEKRSSLPSEHIQRSGLARRAALAMRRRQLVANGKDPSLEKRRGKARSRLEAANTVKAIATEYCAKRKRDGEKGWAPATASRSRISAELS
jgi:hypothetical protein